MEIISSGCSFTWGSELKDATDEIASYNSWASIVANSLGYSHSNCATPGGSNSEITRSVIKSVTGKTKAVIVMWTFPSRFEFLFSDEIAKEYGSWKSITPWNAVTDFKVIDSSLATATKEQRTGHKEKFNTSVKTGLTSFSENYFKHVGHNIFWQQFVSLKEILLLKLWLEAKNIPFYFTLAHTDLLMIHNDAPDIVKKLKSDIADVIHTFDGLGFDQWAKIKKFPYGASHPLEEAHAAAADYILQKITDEKII